MPAPKRACPSKPFIQCEADIAVWADTGRAPSAEAQTHPTTDALWANTRPWDHREVRVGQPRPGAHPGVHDAPVRARALRPLRDRALGQRGLALLWLACLYVLLLLLVQGLVPAVVQEQATKPIPKAAAASIIALRHARASTIAPGEELEEGAGRGAAQEPPGG
ncbi:unnamed protein product [Prorocentrum cordatum]|uniref:Uncharacterized protein n=1 Tax=Prorocentrum cordatum TaxID=2364126 RepID=A0ABN9S068_9DINO|nr:unnamed protein product [Polarella glacialis]